MQSSKSLSQFPEASEEDFVLIQDDEVEEFASFPQEDIEEAIQVTQQEELLLQEMFSEEQEEKNEGTPAQWMVVYPHKDSFINVPTDISFIDLTGYDGKDYDLHFYRNGVRVNYTNYSDIFKTAGIYLLSIACNSPGIFYALGGPSGTTPKDVLKKFPELTLPIKFLSGFIATCFAYIHVPLIAKNIEPAYQEIKDFIKTFRQHLYRNSFITVLAVNGAGAQGVLGYQAFVKAFYPIAIPNAFANFMTSAVIRTLSLIKLTKAIDANNVKIHPLAVFLSLFTFFPFGQKVLEAYKTIGADVSKIPTPVAIPLFSFLSGANAITFAYQLSQFMMVLKNAKKGIEADKQVERPIDSTRFLLRSLFSNKTRYEKGSSRAVEITATAISLPASAWASVNYAADSLSSDETHASMWKGIADKDTPQGILAAGLYATGAAGTYGKLAIEKNFPLKSADNLTR